MRNQPCMSRIRCLCVSLALLVPAVACMSDQEKAILGVWKGTDDQEKIEFMKDGTFVQTEEGIASKGRYEFTEQDKVKVTMFGPGSMSRPFVVTVSISSTELLWGVPGGGARKYHRAK